MTLVYERGQVGMERVTMVTLKPTSISSSCAVPVGPRAPSTLASGHFSPSLCLS